MTNQTMQAVTGLQNAINDYHRAQKDAPFDMAKFAAASLVNDKMLHDTAEEVKEALPGYKTPDAAMLKKMQAFAGKIRKRRPLATEAEINKTVAAAFNLVIVPEGEDAAAAHDKQKHHSGLVGVDGKPLSRK